MSVALPTVIETILSMERPQGGWLAEMGGSMLVTLRFPANTTQTVELRPLEGQYALIAFWNQVIPWLVPDTITVYFQHSGHGIYGGNCSANVIDSGVPGWAVITDSAPLIGTTTNTSNLVQRVEAGYFYAVVYTEEDYELIVKMLKENVGQGEKRRQTISLLDQMLEAQRRMCTI